MATETEAKFLIADPSAWRSLRRLDSLGLFRLSRENKESQTNVYWDTPDGKLRRSGAILKLRKVGPRSTLTFKRQISYRAGMSRRVELARPVRTGITDRFLRRSDSDPAREARRIAGDQSWVPVLTLRTLRQRRIFSLRGKKIELDLDQVTVFCGRRRIAAYREVELENLNAAQPAFHRATSDLRRLFAGRITPSRRSKFEIGLKLSLGKR